MPVRFAWTWGMNSLRLALETGSRGRFMAMFLVALAASTPSASPAWTYVTGNYVWSVAVSADGAYVIAGSDDMHAYFFDAISADAKPLWSYATHGYVRHVAISREGSRAAASDLAGGVFFFERPEFSGAPDWIFRSDYPIDALVLSGDGDLLAAGDRRGNVYLFETSRADPLIWQSSIPGGVLALSLSESGALAATGTKGGLYFFDASLQTSYQWSFSERTNIPCLAFVDDLERIVAAGGDGSLYLIDTLGQLLDRHELGGALSALSISLRTRRVAAGSTNGDVSVFHVDGGLEEVAAVGTKNPVMSTALSGDGERVAVANSNGAISMFDGSLANRIWIFKAGAIVHSLSMSADARILAAGSDTGAVYLFGGQDSGTSSMMTFYIAMVVLIVMAVVIAMAVWRRKRSWLVQDVLDYSNTYRVREPTSLSVSVMKRAMVVAFLFVTFVAAAFMVTPSHAAMAVIKGTVYWYDQFGNLRPLAWAQVVASGDDGEPTMASSTTDGTYMMWVTPGTYNLTASLDPGYTPVSQMVVVTPGAVATVDFQLEQSGEPIPEYPSIVQPIMLGVATLAAALILRRRRVAALWSR